VEEVHKKRKPQKSAKPCTSLVAWKWRMF